VEISDLIAAIQAGGIRITDHADEEAQDDALGYDGILFSVVQGEIVEQYKEDRPYPSCLVYGCTFEGEPVHSVWAYNKNTRWAVLVTVYRPDPERWISWRERRM